MIIKTYIDKFLFFINSITTSWIIKGLHSKILLFFLCAFFNFNGFAQSWQYVGSSVTGISPGNASFPSLAFSQFGKPYIAYQDNLNGHKTTVMTFDGFNWGAVGSLGFGTMFANDHSIAISQTGIPYVAYKDFTNYPHGKVFVMSFDGSNWDFVGGSTTVNNGYASYPSLCFSPKNTPYLAIKDESNGGKTSVLSFNGSNWGEVGSVGISAGWAAYQSLAFSPSGVPYVAYSDYVNNDKTTVLSFNGINWGKVGSAGISASDAHEQSLAFSPSGVPYVAYSDGAYNRAITVLSFNGSNWGAVGSEGTGVPNSESIDLAFNLSGVPYVVYKAGKTSVISFNGSNWGVVGSGDISSGLPFKQSLKSNPVTGEMWVSYNIIAGSVFVQRFGKSDQKIQNLITEYFTTIGGANISLANVTATSGLPVSFISSNSSVASISGTNIITNGLGVTTITAYQLGNSNYNGVTVTGVLNVFCQPTTIVTQPVSKSVLIGSVTGFTVSAVGTNLSYLWNNQATGNTMSTSIPGNYLVAVTGACGTKFSDVVSLTTFPGCYPAAIVTQPVGQTICGASFVALSVSATGSNLTYRWNNGATTTGISTNVAGNYMVTVSGTCGVAVSNIANFTINPLTTIVSQPVSQTVPAGIPATFLVSALGSNLTYTWTNGATGTSMSTSIPGIYLVAVSGTCGLKLSNFISLTTTTSCVPTTITAQPTNQTACIGASANFSVSAVGTNLSYLWNSGATTSNITTNIPGIYTVTVSGTCGNAISSVATLSPIAPTIINTQPVSATVCSGIVQNFSVSASGANLAYLWNSGENTISIAKSVAGSYLVTVSGSCGNAISSVATLVTIATTTITRQPVSATVCSGIVQNFNVSASGANLTYLWSTGETTFSITKSVAGTYLVTVSGSCGRLTSNNARLTTNNCSQLSQTINFPTNLYFSFGALVPINATASSGLPVSLSVNGPAVLIGNSVSLTGLGTVTITATQVGNANYLPAPTITNFQTVYLGSQSFNFVGIPSYTTYTTAPFTLTVTSNSGLPVVISLTGPASFANNTVAPTGVGVVTITAFQAGNSFYRSTTAIRNLQIYKADQTITFSALANKTAISPPFLLTGFSTSGLPLSYSVNGPANVSGNSLSITGVGVVNVTASQLGDLNFKPAVNVTQSFTVSAGARVGLDGYSYDKFVIYPNPADDKLLLSDEYSSFGVNLFNMQGILVFKTQTSNGKIELSSLPEGIYVIQFIEKSGAVLFKNLQIRR